MKKIFIISTLLIVFTTTNCSPGWVKIETTPVSTTASLQYYLQNCSPSIFIKPTQPSVIPGYTQLDETTGLHMTGTIQDIDAVTYRFQVKGKVDHPLSLSIDELRCLPKISAKTTIICPGNFEDVASFSGVPLKLILNLAGVQIGAKAINLIGADKFEAFLPLRDALREDNFLAYEWNDQPLPILHGFPLRAVMPTQVGSTWIKWLVGINVE